MKIKGSGQALRKAREEAKVSLRDLADRLEWNEGTLSKYETNALGVSLDVIDQIADALGYSRETLVFRCLKLRYASLENSVSETAKLAFATISEAAKQPLKKKASPKKGGKNKK